MGQPLSIARRLFLVCECKVTIIFLYLQISERNSLRFISNSLLLQIKRDYCIMRHLLRYYRHSGPVIYTSKLQSPSVSIPCNYPILQSLKKNDCIKKKKLCQKYFDTALLNNYTRLSQVSLERFAVYACLKTADRFFLNLTYTLTSKTKLLAYFF